MMIKKLIPIIDTAVGVLFFILAIYFAIIGEGFYCVLSFIGLCAFLIRMGILTIRMEMGDNDKN